LAARARKARASVSASALRPIGLVRWSKAPRRIASMVLAPLAYAVSMMHGTSGAIAGAARSSARPSSPGRRRSTIAAAMPPSPSARSPASALAAWRTR